MPLWVGLKKKHFRIYGSILFVAVGLILAFNSIVAKIIEQKIDAFLLAENLKHYQVQYDRVGFNFMNRSVSMLGFKYIPDSAFLDSIAKTKTSAVIMALSVGRITFSGIDLRALMNRKEIVLRKIMVKKPEIKLYKFNGKVRAVNKEKKQPGFLTDSVFLAKFYHKIVIKNILFKKTKLTVYNYIRKKKTLSSNRIDIIIRGVKLEPSGHNNHYFYLSTDKALLVAKDNYLALGNPLYEIKFKKLTVDLTHNILRFREFHYIPRYSKKNFSKHIKFQKERFDFYASDLDFSGIDSYRFLNKNEIHVRKITVSNGVIELYRDKNVPLNHAQRPLLPFQAIKRVKGKFKIDSILIRNMLFNYSERIPGRSQLLKVSFSNLSGYLVHMSNIRLVWRKHLMKAALSGRFMHKTAFHLQFTFPMQAKSDTFFFRGNVLGPASFKIFNPAIFPASGLKFTGGVLDKMTFSGSANPRYAVGTMTMLYHDMSFEAMKKKDNSSINKFVSWGVNSFVRRNNPRKGKGKMAKSVSMFYQRDVEKGFGNFFWKTLFSGMKATMIPNMNNLNRHKLHSVSPKK